MNAVIEPLHPTFPGWPVEKIRAAIETIRIMESALEPARSRRGDRMSSPTSLGSGASLPPAGVVLSLPAGGFSS